MRLPLCKSLLFMVCALSAADVERGKTLLQSRDFKAAETEMGQLVSAEAENAVAYRYLGIAQTHLGKNTDAVASLQKAASLDGGTPDSKYALAMAQIEAKQFGEAEATIKEAEQAQSDHPDRQSVKGSWLAAQRRFKESIEPLEAAVTARPDDALAHYYLGLAYSNQRRPDLMVKHFEQFLRLEPDSPNAAKVKGFLRNIR